MDTDMSSWWEEKPKRSKKRTLGIRDKQILLERAGYKCEACGKEIKFAEMQVGHKTAASKGGKATLENCVCLCYKCNKLQGTDSWETFLKKLGKQGKTQKPKKKKKNGVKLFGVIDLETGEIE